MTKLGMGVVGVGTMGKRHAENIRRLIPEAQLIAVADADLARAKQVANELEIDHAYNTVEALVDRKDIQAVAIVTPASSRSPLARRLVQWTGGSKRKSSSTALGMREKRLVSFSS